MQHMILDWSWISENSYRGHFGGQVEKVEYGLYIRSYYSISTDVLGVIMILDSCRSQCQFLGDETHAVVLGGGVRKSAVDFSKDSEKHKKNRKTQKTQTTKHTPKYEHSMRRECG